MFNKMKLFWSLFQKGKEVGNKDFWLRGQAYVQPLVAGLIMSIVALAKAYGYDLPIDENVAMLIGGACFFVVNTALTIITSKHVGLPLQRDRSIAESSVSSADEATASRAEESMPVEDEYAAVEGVGDDVIARAEEWLKQHANTDAQGKHVEISPFGRGD